MLVHKKVEYKDGDVTLEGYYVYDDSIKTKRPAILVSHDWSGLNDLARQKADKLAEMGYVGFALDMYGKGKLGKTNDEKMALMGPLVNDRGVLQKRITAALNTLKNLEHVDADKIGAIGFCFGGLCVLDLARMGTDIKGVVSFHGNLAAPDKEPASYIKASVLVLHGYDDPMNKPDVVIDFCNEMTAFKADWQTIMYGNTMHGFTNPEANDPSFGTVYNKLTTDRGWQAMQDFFKEKFR